VDRNLFEVLEKTLPEFLADQTGFREP
jgi:hypothetical protein